MQYRLDKARQTISCETILWEDGAQDVIAQVRNITQGRGADVCIDAVGFEPERNFLECAKSVILKGGQAPAHKYIDQLMNYVAEGKVKLDDIITHRLLLSDIAHGYAIFQNKEDNCVKVVLDPWA